VLYTAQYMPATRTQIYLTKEQRGRLDELSERRGTTLAGLIREAVDEYLDRVDPEEEATLEATFGVLPALEVPSRDEWDRG
jgi:hypothetical protein